MINNYSFNIYLIYLFKNSLLFIFIYLKKKKKKEKYN